MSSRQEEKERRRQERVEREEAEARKAAGRRRPQLVGGALLAVVAVGAVIAAVVAGSGGDDGNGKTDASAAKVKLPGVQIADLGEAAKAAGCTAKSYPSEGREHLSSDTGTNDKYKTNPPTSGTHRPQYPDDGIYSPGNEPAKENWVHSLEHGRIIIQYKPGTPKKVQDQLEALFNEKVKGVAGYHQLLIQNNTGMKPEVAAVGWTQLLTCPTMNDKVFDAIRAFRTKYVDKGPELIP
ncbi:MAG: DUF3105 domain-containing protein [Solirubrobacterales bacterium]|nr:DUF3105 domain-containing protein [Solirubrobacterales bacterium]